MNVFQYDIKFSGQFDMKKTHFCLTILLTNDFINTFSVATCTLNEYVSINSFKTRDYDILRVGCNIY